MLRPAGQFEFGMQMYNNLLLRGPKIDLKSKNMGFVLSDDKG